MTEPTQDKEKARKALRKHIRTARKQPKLNTTDIHFLHIGKCAGSQVSLLARQVNAGPSPRKIIKHGHDTFLRDLNQNADYFFSIRNPISRFKSGFYSRKRKGAPRLDVPWTAHDEIAFSEFEHANYLAESLFEDGKLGRRAWAAMTAIRHTAQDQSDWFYCRGHFLDVKPPVWILRQEHFDADLDIFLQRSGLDTGKRKPAVSKDPAKAHVGNYDGVPELSEKAKEKLSIWYAQDIAFYDMCENWMEQTLKEQS